MRQLIELAYSTGKSYLSSETGFLHLSYTLPEDHIAHAIPLYENALFALAALRTKTQESIQEGKVLLEKLLHFQAPSGNFPIYLHEFPVCHDRWMAATLMPVLYWVLKDFQQVLGQELKKRVEEAAQRLLDFGLQTLRERKAPDVLAFKMEAVAHAFGKLQKVEAIPKLFSPRALADILIGLQLLDASIGEKSFWHPTLASYVGPAVMQFQYASEPEVTAYDFFMGAWSGQFSKRCFARRHPVQLQAALVQPWKDPLTAPATQSGFLQGSRWDTFIEPHFAFSLIEKKGDLAFPEKGFHPLYFIWGDAARAHTFVLQGANLESLSYNYTDREITLLLDLKRGFNPEEREAAREICFYTETDEQSVWSVEGSAATTFNLGQKITLSHPKMNITLTFTLEEGEGVFQGHLMRGNRPAQALKSQTERFTAFDWQLFVRTIKRSERCRIKISIHFKGI